jgi:hypothetical protein
MFYNADNNQEHATCVIHNKCNLYCIEFRKTHTITHAEDLVLTFNWAVSIEALKREYSDARKTLGFHWRLERVLLEQFAVKDEP